MTNTTKEKSQRPRHKVVVKEWKQKAGQELPAEVGDTLRSLPLDERKAYATLLHNAGWTLRVIAEQLNLTRESIRLYCNQLHSTEALKKIEHLPVPDVPMLKKYGERVVKVIPSPEVIAQLKELQAKANQVRSNSPKYREEAEQYTKLLYETIQSGVTTYRLGKELGVTHSALTFRLVRYGYATSKGKSKSYKLTVNRKRD